MSHEKLMEEYDKAYVFKLDTAIEWIWFIIGCIVGIILIYILIKKIVKKILKKEDRKTELYVLANVIVSILGIWLCVQYYKFDVWADKYAVKYIDSLPDKEMKVEKVVWDTSNKHSKYDVEGCFTKDFLKDREDAITVKVYAKNGKLEIIKYLDVVIKESKNGKTYLKYKYLERDLPLFEKGIYNAVLYVPKG